MHFQKSGPFIEIHAPGKLNLFLEVLARRHDGFHEIVTFMTAISLFDTLRFAATDDSRIHLDCRWAAGLKTGRLGASERTGASDDSAERACQQRSGTLGDLPTGSDNIVFRAVDRLRREAGIERGAVVELVKRIPSAAGLGGASSDAAAVLVAANAAWKLNWSRERLADLAAGLGSDIPFFFGAAAAVCRGRGERVEPVVGIARMYFVVVRPPSGLSTPEVYRRCRIPERPARVESLLRFARAGRIAAVGQCLVNRLQDAACQLSPWIERLQREFHRVDCLGHQMSGSGSSYFGLCRNARHARRVASQLRARGYQHVYPVTTAATPRCDR